MMESQCQREAGVKTALTLAKKVSQLTESIRRDPHNAELLSSLEKALRALNSWATAVNANRARSYITKANTDLDILKTRCKSAAKF